MKTPSASVRPSGFALVVTLTLMVLLSILALGLLSLSSIALRSSQGGNGAAVARANARTALAMAIGEMQRTMGDDRRITIAADQIAPSGSDGSTTEASEGRQHWTGVYKSWEPDLSTDASAWTSRPDPAGNTADGQKRFLGWLVSPPGMTNRDDAKSSASLTDPVELVGAGTAGSAPENRVDAGKVPVKEGTELVGNMAWWVGDQGLKSSISIKEQPTPTQAGDARLAMQSVTAAGFKTLGEGATKPFDSVDFSSDKLAALSNYSQVTHITGKAETVSEELFHDVALATSGLMTNVRKGGFRKDLSMYLENSDTDAQRDELAADVLYTVPAQNGPTKEPGINMEELAAYYKLRTQLVDGSGSYTTGGSIPSSAKMLKFKDDPSKCRDDYFHLFKQPMPIAYDSFFSLEARAQGTPASDSEKQKYQIRIVLDPVVIMWNPLDVPVSIPSASVPSVKFWTFPFNLILEVDSGTATKTYKCPLQPSLGNAYPEADLEKKGDHNYMSLDLTLSGTPLAFKPGEVIMISQTTREDRTDGRHEVSGGPGFDFANGFSTPLWYEDNSVAKGGKPLVLQAGDSIKISLEPNSWTNGGDSAHPRWANTRAGIP